MSLLSNILHGKCPVCKKGKMFNYTFPLRAGTMNETCSHCHTKFEQEPGFFFGAMYVSYALTVAECVAVFVLCQFFFDEFLDVRMIPFLILPILLLAPINYRLSRVIWCYLFSSNYKKQKAQ